MSTRRRSKRSTPLSILFSLLLSSHVDRDRRGTTLLEHRRNEILLPVLPRCRYSVRCSSRENPVCKSAQRGPKRLRVSSPPPSCVRLFICQKLSSLARIRDTRESNLKVTKESSFKKTRYAHENRSAAILPRYRRGIRSKDPTSSSSSS